MDSLTPSAQDFWSKKVVLKGQGHMAKVKVKVSFVLNIHKNLIFMQQMNQFFIFFSRSRSKSTMTSYGRHSAEKFHLQMKLFSIVTSIWRHRQFDLDLDLEKNIKNWFICCININILWMFRTKLTLTLTFTIWPWPFKTTFLDCINICLKWGHSSIH